MAESKKLETLKTVVIVIQCLAFLGLVGFAIFDVHSIIYDYVHDNRLTTARPLNITDYSPFLGKRMPICLSYIKNTFPMTDQQIYDVLDSYFQSGKIPSSGEDTKLTDDDYEHYGQAVLDSYLVTVIGATQGLFEKYKTHPVLFGPNYQNLFDKDSSGIQSFTRFSGLTQTYPMLDQLIERENITEMVKQAWLSVQEYFIRRMGVSDDTKEQMFMSYSPTCWLYFEIPLTEWIQPGSNPSTILSFDFHRYEKQAKNTWKNLAQLQLFFPGLSLEIDPGPWDKTKKTSINIGNTAILNITHFQKCTTGFSTESECLHSVKMRIVSKGCNCRLFAEEMRRILNLNESGNNETIPFCTMERLSQCNHTFDEALFQVDRAKGDGSCKPCVVPKNTSTVTSTVGEKVFGDMSADAQAMREHLEIFTSKKNYTNSELYNNYTRSQIELICQETMVMVFEDGPMFTWSQLVSQVGGDLGLYIGFSMMSFLQLILFLYQICHHEHKKYSISPRESRWQKWRRLFIDYFFEKIDRNQDEAKSKEIEQLLLLKIEENKQDMMNHNYALVERMNMMTVVAQNQMDSNQQMQLQMKSIQRGIKISQYQLEERCSNAIKQLEQQLKLSQLNLEMELDEREESL